MNIKQIMHRFLRSKNMHLKKKKDIKKVYLFYNKNFNFTIKTIFNVIDQLGKNLNKILKLKKSKNYWRYVLSPYISYIVSVTLPIFLYLKKNNTKTKSYNSSYFNKVVIRNFEDLGKLVTNYEFSKEILLSAIYKNNSLFKDSSVDLRIKKNKKKNLIEKFYLTFVKVFIKKVYLIDNITIKNIIYNLFYRKVFIYSLNKINYTSTLKKNTVLRKQIKIVFKKNILQNYYIEKLIQFTLPLTFLEDFKVIQQTLNKKKYNFKVLMSSGAIWSNDIARILSAELKERKCKIKIFQHGGAYSLKNDIINFFDKYLADIFYCWGPPLSKKEKRILPIEINKMANINKSYNDRIIMPLSLPSHLFGPLSSGYTNSVYDIYINDLDIFLENLNQQILKKITLRFQPQLYKNIYSRKEIIKYFSKKYKDIKIIEQPKYSFKKDLINYKFCIITLDSTTFLEALSSNIKFICFWRKDFNVHHSKFKKIYNKLYSSNLFFDEPEKAAKYVNKQFLKKNGDCQKKDTNLISYLRKELYNSHYS